MKKKYHLEIPKENISKKEINKTGFGESVPRFSYSEHGISLRNNTNKFKEIEYAKKDLKVISNVFLQLSTLDNIKIKSHILKIENLGFELVSLNHENKSIANFKIDDDKFELTGTYPNHLKITGKLNDKENFELNIKHHFAVIYLTRFFFLFGTIFSILYSINGIWIPFFFLTILSIFVLLGSKYAEKKAITQFLEKFFEIEKREFER